MGLIKKITNTVSGAVQSVVSAPAQLVSDIKNVPSGNIQSIGNVATLGFGRPLAAISGSLTTLNTGGLAYGAPVVGQALLSQDQAMQAYGAGTLTRDQAIEGLQGAATIGGLAARYGGLGSFTQDDVLKALSLIPSQTKIARDPAGGAVVLPQEIQKSQNFFSYVLIGAGITALLLILKRKK